MARGRAAKYAEPVAPPKIKEPDCSICHIPWPDHPEDEEFIEARALWREHILALTSSHAVREHVKVWAMWRRVEETDAEVLAREWSRSWHTRKFLTQMGQKYEPAREEQPEQRELSDLPDTEPQGPLSAAVANLLDSYMAGYINSCSAQGKPVDPDILSQMQENFLIGRRVRR